MLGTILACLGSGALATAAGPEIRGTDGPDVLVGTPEPETIRGLAGADSLTGDAGADELIGGSGSDALAGGLGDDVLRGGSDADVLAGEEGNDVLDGGSDGDRLNGGPGADVLLGGAGDDVIDARDGEIDQLTCGSGEDTAIIDAFDSTEDTCERRQLPPGQDDVSARITPGEDAGVIARRGTIKVRMVRKGRTVLVALEELDGIVPFGAELVSTVANAPMTLVVKRPDGTTQALNITFVGALRLDDAPGVTELTLEGAVPDAKPGKGKGKSARAAARKRPPRIRAKGKGDFRVRGKYSSATIQGTAFSVSETATTTRTAVTEGVVKVRDLAKKKDVRLKAGMTYVAKRP